MLHVHGQFDKKAEVYVASSFRNQLPDAPIKNIEIDENYYYLYSNALSTHCGAYKEFQIKQHSQANIGIDKLASAYNTDPKLRAEVDSWAQDDNTLTANLGYGVQIKAANPDICFYDDYHFDSLCAINGTIEILGLSPWNDFHIFEAINNSAVDECVFYYYNIDECSVIEKLLPALSEKGKLKFLSVIEFWEKCNAN